MHHAFQRQRTWSRRVGDHHERVWGRLVCGRVLSAVFAREARVTRVIKETFVSTPRHRARQLAKTGIFTHAKSQTPNSQTKRDS